MFFGPGFGGEVFYLPVGGRWQAREDVTQVRKGIDATTAAAFDDGVQDGAAFASLSFADEQPILFAEGGGADGVFHQVLIDLNASVVEVHPEKRPEVERVVDGQAHPTAGQVAPLAFKSGEEAMKPLVNRAGPMGARHRPQGWHRLVFAQFPFEAVKVSHLA